MAKTAKTPKTEIDIVRVTEEHATAWLVGDTAFFCNRMAAKAKRSLLFPAPRMTQQQRATKLKHAPYAEFRDSAYQRRGPGETKIVMRGSAPKLAIAGAALRTPTSVNKTEITQLVRVPEEYCPLWGIPRLDMSVVRQAGMSRTPDIRTRARIEEWAMRVPLSWISPNLNERKVVTLLINAGILCGLGDWRLERGGPFGRFRVVDANDKVVRALIETAGYLAQEEALKNPVCANAESEELMAWYLDELERRGLNPEEEQAEEIEVDNPDAVGPFGFGGDNLTPPPDLLNRLPYQNGPEV